MANFAGVNQDKTITMNDNINEPEQPLSDIRAEEHLYEELQKARCPLCGAKLDYTVKVKPTDKYERYTTLAEIKCPVCECFGCHEELSQFYGVYPGTKPWTVLGHVWKRISRFVKPQD